ncbi:hypothetical protein CHS0354_012452 [Potamilus streckersoni]|uniref:Conserved oligomeric Golgi complex subunit 1 n=1 Tax=Potamilus streckersoni TaxID=2493646 RepID=A0AAE0RUK8_9BIVA|nr:hypothetical protein CHS0354_012452 [Potamilus streckersoni]
MSSEAKSLPVYEMDTNLMFEKFTVDEIRKIEKRTRAEIERKKEDLRTMVGERYRDLIEAADTISEMKKSSQNVMVSVCKIEDQCNQLKQSQMVKGSSLQHKKKAELEQRRKEEAKFYGTASQIKLLLDMPERIWSALESQDYLTASRLFLLSRHINTSLQLHSQHSSDFLYWFPVVSKQWAAISHFRSTILQGCRGLLRVATTNDQKIANCLCSILLLEDSNPRQVFNELLLARTSAIQHLFYSGVSQTGSIKEQVCVVVQLITTTLHQIYAVFYSRADQDEEQTDLLLKVLTKVTTQKQHESGLLDLQNSVSFKCLPMSVRDFCPSLRAAASSVTIKQLQENCQQWIQTCTIDVKNGIGKLLSFVNTVKRLADIRDTMWEQLSQDPNLFKWDEVCHRVLDRSLSVWTDLLRPLFYDRVKSLIQYHLDTTAELTKRQVAKVVTEMASVADGSMKVEFDLSSYIWSESPSDIPPSTAWTIAASYGLLEAGGLMMKAKAYTPIVQSLCKSFDEKMKTLQEDTYCYLVPAEVQAATDMSGLFNRYADTASFLSYIQTSCTGAINEIIRYLDDQLQLWKKSFLEVTHRNTNEITEKKVLMVGRLCSALCDLTPNLQQCMGVNLQRNPQKKDLTRTGSSSKSAENQAWEELRAKLLRCQKEAYRIWVDHLAGMVMKETEQASLAQNEQEIIGSCTKWDEVSIQEETEDGKNISSKIFVPMQASWHLQSLLFRLCQEVNHVGGHAIGRSTLQLLIYSVSDKLIAMYEKILKEHKSAKSSMPRLNQRRALQLLFDLKFILQVIPRKDDTKGSQVYHEKAQKCISELEEIVDPFDLDVFAPYIQSHLLKQSQRCSVLLGSLTSLDKLAMYSSIPKTPSSGQQEQHNILMLSSCQNRFPLLPVSSQPSQSFLPQPVISQTMLKLQPLENSGLSLTVQAAAVLPQPSQLKLPGSSSFYDKLGTGFGSMSELSSWFSNIGSKSKTDG